MDPFSYVASLRCCGLSTNNCLNQTYVCDDIGIVCMTGIYCINWCQEWTHRMRRQGFSLSGLIRDFDHMWLKAMEQCDLSCAWILACLHWPVWYMAFLVIIVCTSFFICIFGYVLCQLSFLLKGFTTTRVPYTFLYNNAMLTNCGSTSMFPQTQNANFLRNCKNRQITY